MIVDFNKLKLLWLLVCKQLRFAFGCASIILGVPFLKRSSYPMELKLI